MYIVARQNKRISQECVFFFFSFLSFFSQCGACWASAAVSARQIAISPSMRRSSPLAISFSHRAKVTWLTTVSHLTMQKDYQFVGLLSDGDASSLSLFLNRPSIMKGCRLRGCVPFVTRCVKCCRHSRCCPHATLITPVENSSRMLFGSTPATGPLTSSHSSFFSFTFFFFFFNPTVYTELRGIEFIFIACS